MAINFVTIDSGRQLKDSRKLREWLSGVVESEDWQLGEVTIALCSDSYMIQENTAYLGHTYATDILTFSYNEGEILSGDILISTDTVASNAKEYGVSYQVELQRVMVHGILHLVGYDDMCDQDRVVMRSMEDKYLGVFPV
ncbi:MAG: rRNA maturation RNase YbeY [Rikenellaceae bacterium]